MKYYKLAAATVVLGLVASAGVWAQDYSKTLTLKGSVPLVLELTIAPIGNLNDLDLLVNFSADIATVTEKTNKRTGYDIAITSANAIALGTGPAFKGASVGNSETLSYSLSYDGVPLSFSSGKATITGPTAKTTSAGTPRTVALQYNGVGQFLGEDTYEDTLTFTISAK